MPVVHRCCAVLERAAWKLRPRELVTKLLCMLLFLQIEKDILTDTVKYFSAAAGVRALNKAGCRSALG